MPSFFVNRFLCHGTEIGVNPESVVLQFLVRCPSLRFQTSHDLLAIRYVNVFKSYSSKIGQRIPNRLPVTKEFYPIASSIPERALR